MIGKTALLPLTAAYRGVTSLRNWFYNVGIFKSRGVKAKVISVGNLTVGGTGKTPVVLTLIELLKKRNLSVGVISRGYKRTESGILEVDLSPRAAVKFGDEPTLIKAAHPDVIVVVGEKRVVAAEELLRKKNVDVIICDDAFQHRSIRRDLDILLLDATEPRGNYRLLPAGRAREAMRPALKRADLIVLTKANLLGDDELKTLREWLSGMCSKPVIRADYLVKGFSSLSGDKADTLKDAVYLVSGIAKPQTLDGTLEGKVKIVKHKFFPDHHRYSNLDVESFLEEASSLGARWILTTPKDATKLGEFSRLRDRLWVAQLGLKLSGDTRDLNAALDRLDR